MFIFNSLSDNLCTAIFRQQFKRLEQLGCELLLVGNRSRQRRM
jgi:anti-anti-sigma regulatory factor